MTTQTNVIFAGSKVQLIKIFSHLLNELTLAFCGPDHASKAMFKLCASEIIPQLIILLNASFSHSQLSAS